MLTLPFYMIVPVVPLCFGMDFPAISAALAAKAGETRTLNIARRISSTDKLLFHRKRRICLKKRNCFLTRIAL